MTWFEDIDDGAYPGQFVVHNDGESYELVGVVPGPAGAIEVELVDGVTVQVDFAEPTQATSLIVADGEVPPILARLIGGSRSDMLEDHLDSGSRRATRLAAGSDRPVDRRRRPGRSLDRTPVSREAIELGAVAVLRSIGEDDRFDDLTRAVALIESVDHQRRVDDLFAAEGETDIVLDTAADLLDGLDARFELVADRDGFLALELSKLLTVHAGARLSIARAARLLEPGAGDLARSTEVASSALHFSIAMDPSLMSIDEVPRIGPEVELSDGGLLTFRPSWWAVGQWLRVMHRGPMVLLALVPILDEEGEAVARAVLGSGFTLDELDLEITDQPLPEPTATIDRIARAVALGRRATVAASTGSPDAVESWTACADAWAGLGDERRASLARRYARRATSGRAAFLAERVHALIDETLD